ncbi:MAG: AzlC family ABC transporter permease [Micrococcales bacterium]|nr:AzlC family ABC transporter permease [Micrococcales bacterium]
MSRAEQPGLPESDPQDTLAPERRREILRQAISVGAATGAYGVSFGALATAAGLSVLQAQALSALLFTGGSQFAIVGILAAGGAGSAAIATSSLLGVRNGLYALEDAQFLKVRGLRRVAAAQLTIDESTAVGLAQPEESGKRLGFWATGLAVFVLWNLTTFIGALAGNALGDPKKYGLDAAAAAAFCALVWPRLRSADALVTAAFAAALALAAAPHTPAGVPVLIAVIAAVVVGVRRHPGLHEKPIDITDHPAHPHDPDADRPSAAGDPAEGDGHSGGRP